MILSVTICCLGSIFPSAAVSEQKADTVDVWDEFLRTLENHRWHLDWENEPELRQKLIAYFKAKIEAGVSNGKTSLPPMLMDHVERFPDEMRRELRAYAQRALETDPNNGAAAKFLAIDMAPNELDPPPDEVWALFEKATRLVPKDVELCYLVFVNSGFHPTSHADSAVVALERLFERHRPGEKPTLYYLLHRLCYDYGHVLTRPNDFYKELKEDGKPLEQWTAVMIKIQTAFEERLAREPKDWRIIRMLSEIHEALGNANVVRTVFRTAQRAFEEQLKQNPEDWNALNGSANIHEFYEVLDKGASFKQWLVVMDKIQTVYEERLAENPEDWYAVRMLSEIHEALGNTDAVRTLFKTAQRGFEKRLEQEPENRNALNALANIHERLGNAELAYEYKVKHDPTLAWIGQVLPDFPATLDLEGEPISLAAYRGKVLLLDFWAVWCGPCVGEMPDVKKAYEKYHDEGFDVIGISLDEDEAVLRAFIAEHELPWRQILDSGGWQGVLAQKYGIRSIPAPFLLDREGKVISVKARGDRLDELVAAEMERKTE